MDAGSEAGSSTGGWSRSYVAVFSPFATLGPSRPVLRAVLFHTAQLDTMVMVHFVMVVVVGLLCLVDVPGLCRLPALVMAYAGNRSRPQSKKQ
jgi:hypothetical protein